MALRDVQFYSCGSEYPKTAAFRTNITAATFVDGEPVVYSAGEITNGESGGGGVDPTAIVGIAAESAASRGSRMAALEVADTNRTVYLWDSDNTFICSGFATDGAATAAAPTVANAIGQQGNLVHDGTSWRFDTGAANTNAICEKVLDADRFDISDELTPQGTGVYVIIRPL